MRLRHARVQGATLVLIAATALSSLICTAAHAQSSDQAFNEGQFAHASTCQLYGCGNGNSNGSSSAPHIDPCFLRQNALIPCNSSAKPPEVDPSVVGIWELALQAGRWVLEVHRDGTYRFHSEAGDGAQPHAGNFSASNGRWPLIADSGYRDNGTYVLQGQDTWLATGHLGTGAWHRHPQKTASVQR